eukprot:gene22636-42978_t
MRFRTEDGTIRETVGVLGALEVVDEGAGGVLPHERTTPKAKTDRLDLTRATEANLSPVWGLSLTAGLTDLLLGRAELVGTCTDDDGVVHTVERVTDPSRVAAIAAAVGANPVLIADGHRVKDLLVDQGTADGFLDEGLRPQLLEVACAAAGIPFELQM